LLSCCRTAFLACFCVPGCCTDGQTAFNQLPRLLSETVSTHMGSLRRSTVSILGANLPEGRRQPEPLSTVSLHRQVRVASEGVKDLFPTHTTAGLLLVCHNLPQCFHKDSAAAYFCVWINKCNCARLCFSKRLKP